MGTHHGTIAWTELNTWEPDKAKAYYGAVMGWTFTEAPTAGTNNPRPYLIAHKDGQPVAGIFTMYAPDFDGLPNHWFTYIAIDDMSQAIAASDAAGGHVRRQPFEIPGTGLLAIVADNSGAVMGFLEPAQNT